jgi:PAS domain S-box-containing protein
MDLKSNLKYLLLISIISISAFFTINYFVELKVDSIKKDKFSTISNNVKMLIDQAIEDKIYSTLNLAISISEYASSHKLLSKQNKEELKNLKNISMKIEKNSNFRNLWIHVVDAKGISRYRNWSEKSGDYLLNVRKELISLLKKPKIVNLISVGIFDISFKSIVPIYEGEKFMGLIETITKFNSIAKKFQEKGIDFLILVDKKYKEQIKKPFSKLFIDDYYVANINAKKELLNLTKNNLSEFLNIKNYEINSNKFITRYEIKDFKNNEMANVLTFQNYNKIFLNEIQSLENSLRIIGYLSTLIIIAIFSTYYYFNKSKYAKTLEKEVKNRTKALNQLIRRYKQLFEGSRAIKIVVDPESMNIFDANKAALDFYGYSKEEIKKLKSSDININIKENENIFKDILKEQKNIFYFKHKLANGKIRDVEVYSSLIDVDNKKLIYSIIRDITEELKLKKEFEEKQKLFYQQAKMASMGEMLENIAHQWRQPLSTITTAASGIKLKKEFGLLDDTFFNDSVGIIIRSANYLSQTIEDFRNFFKHSDNKEKFQISTAIQESFNILRLKINSNSVKTYLRDDSKVIIEGFKNEFIQVFLNLINNSIDTFKNMEDENRIILINIEKVKNSVEISFQDSAKGINKEIIDKIFEPYFTTKHKSQGTGIGLYMSEQIINKHFDGRIAAYNADFELDSKKYHGAKFTITLPLS